MTSGNNDAVVSKAIIPRRMNSDHILMCINFLKNSEWCKPSKYFFFDYFHLLSIEVQKNHSISVFSLSVSHYVALEILIPFMCQTFLFRLVFSE